MKYIEEKKDNSLKHRLYTVKCLRKHDPPAHFRSYIFIIIIVVVIILLLLLLILVLLEMGTTLRP